MSQTYQSYWQAPPYELSAEDSIFLEDLERDTFNWFWQRVHPVTSLSVDRSSDTVLKEVVSVAAVGFGLTAYGIGSERGYVSREQAATRVDKTLRSLLDGKMGSESQGNIGFRGWFYHFLGEQNGVAVRTWNSELSSIDTAWLLTGVMFVRNYFDNTNDLLEQAIRDSADSIIDRVEWRFMLNPNNKGISAGWFPESGYIDWEYRGYNEAMTLYILGLGAETNPIPEVSWQVWTSGYRFGKTVHFNQFFILFAPLFGHHYPQAWIDFRALRNSELDKSIFEDQFDYFENGRRATYAGRAYGIANPNSWPNYGELEWGLTACDGPPNFGFNGYFARGASDSNVRDDGTIAPTAAGGSLPYAPEICIPTLRNQKEKYGSQLYGNFGFRDAYNDSVNWFDADYIGIDQGAILLMIENFRSGLVWQTMKKDPIIQRGLQRAGFTGGWLDSLTTSVELPTKAIRSFRLQQNYPNPFNPNTTISFLLEQNAKVRLEVFDVLGRRVATLINEPMAVGSHKVDFRPENLASGILWYRLSAGTGVEVRKMLYLK